MSREDYLTTHLGLGIIEFIDCICISRDRCVTHGARDRSVTYGARNRSVTYGARDRSLNIVHVHYAFDS